MRSPGSRRSSSALWVAVRIAPAGGQQAQRREIAGLLAERVEERPREGVAHDGERLDALALDRVPDVVGVETLRVRLHDDRAAHVPHAEGHPVGRAVHERRCRKRPRAGPRARAGHQRLEARRHAARCEGREEDVLLAPQHALRHAGGAARVEHVEIVRREAPRRRRLRRGEGRLVVESAGQQRLAGFVRHLQPERELRELAADAREERGEARVIDHRPGLRVPKQVEQLLVHVAPVDVEGHGARLEGAEHALEILVPVVEIEGDVVLPGLVPGEAGALAAAAEPVAAQHVGEAPRAVRDLRPAEAPLAEHQALALGHRLGDGLVERGEIQHGERMLPEREAEVPEREGGPAGRALGGAPAAEAPVGPLGAAAAPRAPPRLPGARPAAPRRRRARRPAPPGPRRRRRSGSLARARARTTGAPRRRRRRRRAGSRRRGGSPRSPGSSPRAPAPRTSDRRGTPRRGAGTRDVRRDSARACRRGRR